MYSRTDLQFEAQEALDTAWFVQSLEEMERTDITLSLRLYIRRDLFVQAFLGEQSGSLYFALIESRQRIFGVDREGDDWHVHPYDASAEHAPLSAGLGPKSLLAFLDQGEELCVFALRDTADERESDQQGGAGLRHRGTPHGGRAGAAGERLRGGAGVGQ